MPFVGEDSHPACKRRWSDDDESDVYALYPMDQPNDFYVLNQPQRFTPRKILPVSKRARIADDDLHIHTDLPSPPPCHRRRRPSQPRVLQLHPATAAKQPQTTSSARLAPCHICHRKPTKKCDLDSFAECQGCGEQTCFVCIRECQGWNLDEGSGLSEPEVLSRSFHMYDIDDLRNEKTISQGARARKGWDAGGHRAVVCSRCCIERGAEGDVACLGCLSHIEGA